MTVTENTVGREPITIVEIDQDFCNLDYGVLPCTAALGVTGQIKCFNTLATCQDQQNFNKGVLTLRFCTMTSSLFTEALVVPTVKSVSTRPTEINIGGANRSVKPLGKRATVDIVIKDMPSDDKKVDKYVTERNYNPLERGTFWSKWIKRNPFYQNRPIRVLEGYVGQTLAQMRTRHYVIENIDGVSSTGEVRIRAKDILKLADDKNAQAPIPSTGALDQNISSDINQVFNLIPSGIGDAEYPLSGLAVIADEIVEFSRTGDVVSVTSRGLRSTPAQSHSEGDTFQLCKAYNNVRVDNVIYDLLVNFANISPAFIDLAEWNSEASTFLANYLLTTVISEPTGVNKLLSELVEQCICYIFWDELAQKIRFKAIRPLQPNTESFAVVTENNTILADSFKAVRKADERLSRVQIYYNQVNPTETEDKKRNYTRLNVRADLDAELEREYGEKAVKDIFSRWLDASNGGEVITTSSRILTRYRDTPLYITFEADAKDRNLTTADVIQLTHRTIVDNTGQPEPINLQIISSEEIESGHKMRYKCQEYIFSLRLAYIVENNTPDYSQATDQQKSFGAWIAPDSGVFADGTEAYKII